MFEKDKCFIPPMKITHYLLGSGTKKARSRREFFTRFGFDPSKWEVLHDALLEQARNSQRQDFDKEDEYGVTYVIHGPIRSPDGRNPLVSSYWIVRADDPRPQLTSAIGKGQQK